MPHYLILDVENTGLFDYTKAADAPGQPRVAQVGLIFVSPSYEIEAEHEFLIKPEGWSMTPEATAVNGLTNEMLIENGVPIRKALDLYGAGLDARRVVVGHNVLFDLKCMRAELRREGMDDRYLVTRSICTMFGSRDICRVPNVGRRGFKNPKLHEACAHFGITQGAGHTALSDARDAFAIMKHMIAMNRLPEPKNPYDKKAKAPPKPRAKKATIKITGNEEIPDFDEIPEQGDFLGPGVGEN